MQNRIPKIIHYCWFGGNPLPELAKKCIDSWKKYCPDYEFVEWNENNFDLDRWPYVREAYDAKKWAFVSDVARLYALVTYGGIYMDTDVEVLKPLDRFLEYEAVSGFQFDNRVPTGLMACRKNNSLFCEFMQDYDERHFLLPDGSYDLTPNVILITDICRKYGLVLNGQEQTVKGFKLFPADYFCPKDPNTGIIHSSSNTYAIHHFDASWKSDKEHQVLLFAIRWQKFLPINVSKFVATVRYFGVKKAFEKVKGFICYMMAVKKR